MEETEKTETKEKKEDKVCSVEDVSQVVGKSLVVDGKLITEQEALALIINKLDKIEKNVA